MVRTDYKDWFQVSSMEQDLKMQKQLSRLWRGVAGMTSNSRITKVGARGENSCHIVTVTQC